MQNFGYLFCRACSVFVQPPLPMQNAPYKRDGQRPSRRTARPIKQIKQINYFSAASTTLFLPSVR